MIDWGTIGKIWSAYGVNILVLVILLLIAWAVGIVVQRMAKTGKEDKGSSKKE